MCPTCGAFIEPANINDPVEYRDLIRKLIGLVNQGTLKMTKGSCPLDRVLEDPSPKTFSSTTSTASPADARSPSAPIRITAT